MPRRVHWGRLLAAALAALLAACAGGGGSTSPPVASFQIRGRVLDVLGAPAAGVSVAYAGAASGTATTGADGYYELSATPGDYTLTPARAGYKFVPDHLDVRVAAEAHPGQDFVMGSGSWDLMVWNLDNWE